MSYLMNNQQKLNDLIFENRNKEYGAYAIRSDYGNTMLKSLSLMIFGFGTIVTIAYYNSHRPADVANADGQIIPDIIYTIPVDLKKELAPDFIPDKKVALKEPGNKLSTNSSNIVLNDSLSVDTRTVLNETVPNVLTSVTSASGTATETGSDSKGTGSVTEAGDNRTAIKGNYEVDAQPEFEGGLAALYKFVSSRLKYPEPALDGGIQGVVYVKFVVDEKGKVGNLSLLNNLGYGLDDEAKRVVSMIPNFKSPAKIKGVPVKVYYQLPIKFKYR